MVLARAEKMNFYEEKSPNARAKGRVCLGVPITITQARMSSFFLPRTPKRVLAPPQYRRPYTAALI